MIISGKVKDSAGTFLPNAHVIAGTKGTTTNFNGEYHIEVGKNDSIKFSYIGMKTLRYKANQVPEIIQMEDQEYELNEVVLRANGRKPFYHSTGFQLAMATLFLGVLLMGKPKKSTGLKGYARVSL